MEIVPALVEEVDGVVTEQPSDFRRLIIPSTPQNKSIDDKKLHRRKRQTEK